MKTKLFFTSLLILSLFNLTLAQDNLQFGIRSNIGVFGLKLPNGYEIEDTNLNKVDGFYKYPKLAFSFEVLTEYIFMQVGDWSMALQLGLGYNYISFKKEWHFKEISNPITQHSGSFLTEQQIIHDLDALYLTMPLRGSLKYKKWKGSLGLCGSRIFYASADRTFKSRSGNHLSEWSEYESQWRSFKKQKDTIEFNTPYLSRYFALQGIISLEYQLMKNIFIGLETRRYYYLPNLHVRFIDSGSERRFFYDGKMWSVSILYMH